MLFDVSLSMMADDVEPDRFVAAQEAARDFVAAVDDGVEVGLVSFSGDVSVEVDPTLDRDAVERGIDNLELAESTAIGDALAAGTRLLVNSADPNADPDTAPGVMVLLSDGETTVGRPTDEGAQEAADAGIPVYTIAFGTEGGEITDPETGDVVPVPVRPADLATGRRDDGRRGVRGPDRRRARERLRPDRGVARRDDRRTDRDHRPNSPGSGRSRRSSPSCSPGLSACGGSAAWSDHTSTTARAVHLVPGTRCTAYSIERSCLDGLDGVGTDGAHLTGG